MKGLSAWRWLAAAALLAPLAAAQSNLAKYLEQNRQALDPANFDAKLLDVGDKQIILLGESHGIAVNEDLDLALLRYLHQHAGVRVYLGEFGYAAGFALNQYLESGDEQVLDYVMKQSEGTVGWTKERRDFFVRLRKWNVTLPAADRVRFAGVDVEHQRGLAVRCLAALATGRTAPAAIADVVAKLRAGQSEGLATSLKEHRAEYDELLGPRFFDFELIAQNLQKANEYYAAQNGATSYEIRERAMYATFQRLYERMGGGRWYGRWGSFHVLQTRAENRDRFAAMLNQPESPVAGKVLTILALYRASEALIVPGYKIIRVPEGPPPVEPFAAAAAGPITLFRLPGETAAVEGVQYVALIQKATPSHTLEQIATSVTELPPVVIRTVPESGSRNVPPDLAEVRVTFSKEMKDRSWSWCSAPPFPGPPLSNLHYDADRRTIIATAKLEPGKQYAVWLNKEGCSSFRDAQGNSAVPYLFSFETAAK